jgi:hypothetical protein
MITNPETTNTGPRDIIQQTTGIYPVTALGISFYAHCEVDLLICSKDGTTAAIFKENPVLEICQGEETKKINIDGQYTNGLVEALHQKKLPAVILCTPPYIQLQGLLDELAEIAVELNKKDLLRHYLKLNRFYYPTIILASNGIIYDEAIYNLKTKLQERQIPEAIIKNICSKVVRASIMQGAYRDNNVYYPHQKGLIKIAVPRYDMFMPVVELLNSKGFTFSIHTNPRRVEFEKAMINIATNTVAMVFTLDKKNKRLNKINIKNALTPSDTTHSRFVNELQRAVFEIGQHCGAFSESETFEKVWQPRQEQILKHDSTHISSSLYCFKSMIQSKEFPQGLPAKEYALIYPLKCYAKHHKLNERLLLLAELEQMIINNIDFARRNADTITFTF